MFSFCYCVSGGYNIKTGPGCMIELMKFDMGGSAAVFGAAKAIGQIKPLGVEVCYLNYPVYFFFFKEYFLVWDSQSSKVTLDLDVNLKL